MRENFIQTGTKGHDQRTYLEGDWFNHGIPSNVVMAGKVYIDTSYGFAGFNSGQPAAMFIDEASGCYDRSSFITSGNGKIHIGKFSILNGTTLISNNNIAIGDHCMLSWGSVITDSWLPAGDSKAARRELLETAAVAPFRQYPFFEDSKPVVLEDNCWVGFGAVIMPGVRLGKGCIIGCKTIITRDVPPYAIVAGGDAKIIRFLLPDDTEEEKQNSFKACLNQQFF
ncbi:MAG: acyltransferase [Ferruginibacter sp.]